MKKLLIIVCASALLGLVAGCVDPVNNVPNPNYDPITDMVKTSLVINVAPANKGPQTKQSVAAVQVDTTFRGLGNATLFTFQLPRGDGLMIPRVVKPAAGGGNDSLYAQTAIPLSTALLAGSINQTSSNDGSVPNSRRVIDMTVPKGINTLLFYGEAVTGADLDSRNAYGALEYTQVGLNIATIGCWAKPRLEQFDAKGLETQESKDFDAIADIILDVLNHLFMVGINGSDGWDDRQVSGYLDKAGGGVWTTYDMTGKEIHWKDFAGITDGSSLSAIPRLVLGRDSTLTATLTEQILANAYNAFVTFGEKELRSGSGPSIARMMEDLDAVLEGAMASASINEEDEVAMLIVKRLDWYIHKFFEVATSGSNSGQFVWKSLSEVVSALADIGIIDSKPSGTAYTVHDFPFHFDLPMGAVSMLRGRTEDSTFVYNTKSIVLSGMGGGTGDVMSVYDYTYPPSIVYYGNAPIRISTNNSLTNRNYPDSTANWEDPDRWGGDLADYWEPGFGHVTSETRGIAMAYNIQYGNAMLETTVRYARGIDSLYDNNNIIHPGEKAKGYKIGEGSISLTGVLVGGQPNKVGWCYLPVDGASFSKMVYDRYMNDPDATPTIGAKKYYMVTIPSNGDKTKPNYTTVFDNYVDASAQNIVYVALEFQNNLGKDFWGIGNMIRNGGTFYIIGKLAVTGSNVSFPSDFWENCSKIMPPYTVDSDGWITGTKQVLRVFMQDHITKADFVINENSLKYAYITVPDLRASKMSIGLSVDLVWKEGGSYDNIILGAN